MVTPGKIGAAPAGATQSVRLGQNLIRFWRRSDRGVTLVEFALVLPILVILFIGLVEFTQAFIVWRKLTTAATAVSDLVSQEASVNCSYLDDVKQVANEIMKPYNAPKSLVIMSVVKDAANNQTIAWSYPAGATSIALPQAGAGILSASSSLIVTEAVYDFTPTIGHFLGSFQIKESAYFRPRLTASVAKTGC
jgi:TadE-like protein